MWGCGGRFIESLCALTQIKVWTHCHFLPGLLGTLPIYIHPLSEGNHCPKVFLLVFLHFSLTFLYVLQRRFVSLANILQI